jgi:hypothetical protein
MVTHPYRSIDKWYGLMAILRNVAVDAMQHTRADSARPIEPGVARWGTRAGLASERVSR